MYYDDPMIKIVSFADDAKTIRYYRHMQNRIT
jgi:hypothetical protein